MSRAAGVWGAAHTFLEEGGPTGADFQPVRDEVAAGWRAYWDTPRFSERLAIRLGDDHEVVEAYRTLVETAPDHFRKVISWWQFGFPDRDVFERAEEQASRQLYEKRQALIAASVRATGTRLPQSGGSGE
jgi:hypothetical protein